MSRSWVKGSSRAWRKLRAYVLERDGWLCRAHADDWCRQAPGEHECTGRATDAHHVYGRAATGDDPRYIVASCGPCNRHIGDPGRFAAPKPRAVSRW